MKSELTLDRLRALLSYDEESGVFHRVIDRGPAKAGDVAGSPSSHGYLQIRIDGRGYWAHRLAWFYVTGEWPGLLDHVDGDRTNNSLKNLRLASKAQSIWNRRVSHRSETGFKGVHKHGEKFLADIWKGRKHIRLGVFDTAKDAAEVYNFAAKQFRGEFARLNAV